VHQLPSPRVVVGLLIVLVVVAAVVSATEASPYAGAAGAGNTIVITSTQCAPGWSAPRSGQTVFTVDNTTRNDIFGVDVVGANQLTVYGEIEMLAPGTSDQMPVVLPPGRYSFECESFAGSERFSQSEVVEGPPVDDAHGTVALTKAVDAGDLDEARLLWLPAHLDYERLGAAYDTFGNFNDEINGRPLGLQGGVNNPHWEGFFRLEYGLWHAQSVAELVPVANALDRAVHGLVEQFPSMVMPINDLSLRTHEILENTLQFELTGETDEGSNTNLATAWANAQGTELALAALVPLLESSDPALLAQVKAGLTAITAELKSYERPNGTWTPLQSLTTGQREQLDGNLDQLLEELSHIPDLFDIPITPESPND